MSIFSWPFCKLAFILVLMTLLCLFITTSGMVILWLYMDDMTTTGSDSVVIAEVKQHLFCKFEMKNLVF